MTNSRLVTLGSALVLALASVTPVPAQPQCIDADLHGPTLVEHGTYTCICETYFMGFLVNTSTAPCKAHTEFWPAHYHCNGVATNQRDCIAGIVPINVVTQPYKCECESSSGLEVEVGGVQYTIGWWEAKCKRDGSAINSPINLDGVMPCPQPH